MDNGKLNYNEMNCRNGRCRTPEFIQTLKPNEVFVFGSNTLGMHGAGAALQAYQYHGAIWGQARGLQGQSYGIVTKDLKYGLRSVPLDKIKEEIEELYRFAGERKDLTFYVTKIGCGLGGYKVDELRTVFLSVTGKPDNVILPVEFC